MYLKLIFIFTCLLSVNGFAECDLKNANDIIDLVKANHPSIKLNKNKMSVYENRVDVAEQRPNPEIDFSSSIGDSIEGKVYTNSVSLQHTFEFGGKRDARVRVAMFEQLAGSSIVESENQDAIISSIIQLYRLRQLNEFIPLYEESLGAFNKILNRMKKSKSISPEQQVEKLTLELATNDYKLKIAKLNAEKIDISKHLTFYMGNNCEIPVNALPKDIELDDEFTSGVRVDSYSKLVNAKYDLEIAHANYSLEKAISYPDIKIGPTFELEKVNVSETSTVGLAVTFDLPFFHANGGGRAKASKEIIAAATNLKNIERESRLDMDSWVMAYNRFRDSLKTTAKKEDLEIKHQKIESLFRRGIISTSLVIESHRQLIEFTDTRFEFELGAIQAKWKIYKIIGELDKRKL